MIYNGFVRDRGDYIVCACGCLSALQSARPSWSDPAAWWCWQTRVWSSTVWLKETLFPLSAGGKMILTCLREGNSQRPSVHTHLPCKHGVSYSSFISWMRVSVLSADLKSKRTIPWLFAKWPLQTRAPIHAWWKTWLESLRHPPRSLYTVSKTRPSRVISNNWSTTSSSISSLLFNTFISVFFFFLLDLQNCCF